MWNTPVQITDNNKDWVYQNMKNTLVTSKFIVMLLYFYINYQCISQKNLNPIIITGLIVLLFGSLLFFCLQCKKEF